MKRTLYIAVAVSAAIISSGCQSQIEIEDMSEGTIVSINPSISGTVAVSQTKAGTVTSTDGSFEIPLFCTVESGIGETEAPETKGQQLRPTSSGSSALSTWLDTFYVTAWDGTTRFMPASGETATFDEVKYSSSAWTITGKEYKWDKNKDITFYAFSNLPSSGASVDGTSGDLTLTYTSVPTDAKDQTDIVMGYYKGKGSQDSTDKKKKNADIVFHHPMAAVQFALGDFGDITVKVKTIVLKGVHSGGSAVLTGTSAAATDPENRFTWSRSLTMQDVTLDGGSSYLSVNSSTKVIGAYPFILVPQELSSKNVSVTIVAELDGVETVLSTVLKTGSWKAGNTYTYSISKEINYDYTFKYYSREISETKASRMFDQNVDGSQTIADIYVTSTKAREDKPDDLIDQNWNIKSYHVGSGAEQTAQNNVIDIIANPDYGIKVTKGSSSNQIKVEAAARVKFGRGMHDYWVNAGSRTDELDWSPADWTSSTSSNPVDLSKYNFQTDTPNAFGMTTANCYIIRHAGKYKLPLVYGNAIVNGTTNTQSYYPKAGMSSSSGDYAGTNGDKEADAGGNIVRLVKFENYKGVAINNPNILTDINKSYSAIHAAILWQSDAQVVSNLSVVAGGSGEPAYLQFDVSQNTICQNDALIAILDASNNIIWSWQIWTTNDPSLSDGPIRVKNYDGEAYDFLPITNIGFIEGQTYKGRDDIVVTLEQEASGKTLELTIEQPEIPSDGFSSIYQYGRKDPMCYNEENPAYVNTTIVKFDDPYDDPDEGTMTSSFIIADPQNGTLKNSILYPFCFFHFEYGYHNERWVEHPYRNLWSGIDAIGGNKNQTTGVPDNERCIKTVYDPSPVGYKVPAGRCFSGFTTTGDNLYGGAKQNADKINGYVAPYGQGIYFYCEQGANHTVNTGGDTILFKLSGIRVGLTGELRTYESMYYGANCEDNDYASRPSIMSFNTQVTPTAGITFLNVVSNAASNGCSVRPVVDITYSNNPFKYVE